MRQEHDLMTLKEIAEVLNVGSSTPYKWVNRGILPAIKTMSGGTIRVHRSDFENFIKKIGGTAHINNNATSEC